MRDINLFPRKPFFEQYRTVALLAIAAVGSLLLIAQYLVATDYRDDAASAERERQRTEQEIAALTARLAPDERTVMYERLLAATETLKASRNDWLSDMTYVLGYMPDGAVMTRINVGNNDRLDLEMKFASETDVVQYLVDMQSERRFRGLRVIEFKKVEEETDAGATETEASAETIASAGEEALPDIDEIPIEAPAEESLTEGELAVRELLLSNPDDLSDRLKQLLKPEAPVPSAPATTPETPVPSVSPTSEPEEGREAEERPSTPYVLNLEIPIVANGKAVSP
ncbi:hypothetical protein [Cohnella sp. GCM10027633]|uniref:hypothetical protein n=1 Tax=unclassified Cohnella TaxID=2636738 RepID=UPI00363FF700